MTVLTSVPNRFYYCSLMERKSRFFQEFIFLYFGILLLIAVQEHLCRIQQEHHGNPESNYTTIYKQGNSSINATWIHQKLHDPTLFLTCQGTDLICADVAPLPSDFVSNLHVYVKSCPTHVLTCRTNGQTLKSIADNLSEIVSIQFQDIIGVGEYVLDSLHHMIILRELQLFLRDGQIITHIPLDTISNDIVTVNITGGNLQEFPYMKSLYESTLYSLSLYNNNITSLADDVFYYITLFKLEIVDNDLEYISANTFTDQESLQSLLIKSNKKLKSIDFGQFYNVKFLKSIHLENNVLDSVVNEDPVQFSTLEEITIKNNLVKVNIGHNVFTAQTLKKVVLTNSSINTLQEKMFAWYSDIRQLDLSNNVIETFPPALLLSNLESINLKRNKLKAIGSFLLYKQLTDIDLSYNTIRELPSNIFNDSKKLRNVWLQGNEITELNLDLFNQPLLETVSLASNKIQRVNTKNTTLSIREFNLDNNDIVAIEYWIHALKDVELLNISNNKINTFQESHIFVSFQKITIDLRYNNISYIIRDMMDEDYSKNIANKTRLFLSNNPLQCNCLVTKILQTWRDYGILLDFEKIICSDGKPLTEIKLYLVCDHKEPLITLIGASCIGSLILLLIVLELLSNRNKIWQRIKDIFNNRTENLTTIQRRQEELKAYDLFISFAHTDAVFVMDNLLPKLEDNFHQKVCIHYRDWIVGNYIPDQIIQSVENSIMTVIILTEYFLDSEWSKLEFNTAHNLSLQEKKSKIIIILLDETIINSNKLSAEIKSHVVVGSYLLWGDPNFWKTLQQMLPRKGKRDRKRNKTTSA